MGGSLIITIGCPGAGKSTWADDKLPLDTLRLERDRFREALFGSRRAYHDSPLDHIDRHTLITDTMLTAMDMWPVDKWAITDTGLNYVDIEPFVENMRDWRNPNAGILLVIFDRSPDYLREINLTRPLEHRIPDDILEERIEWYQDPKAWWRTSPFEKLYVS